MGIVRTNLVSMNSDDNIPQTDIDLDAIEAETARMVEKYKLRSALPPELEDSENSKDEPSGTLIKLETAKAQEDDLEKLSSYFDPVSKVDSDITVLPSYSNYQLQVEQEFMDGWAQYDDSDDSSKKSGGEWNDDGVYDAFEVDDDDTYVKGKSGVRWDNSNHCYVGGDSQTKAKWWQPQDDSELLAGISDKIDEANAQVDHISNEFAALESVVDEVSSSVVHTSRVVGKISKEVKFNKEVVIQMAEEIPKAVNNLGKRVGKMEADIASVKRYLQVLVEHFIGQEASTDEQSSEKK